jgi:hypothetical protein
MLTDHAKALRRMNKLGKSEYVKYGYGMVGITVPIGVMVYY